MAELSSVFTSNDLGILFDQQGYSAHLEEHEAYLEGWIKVLKETPDFLFESATMAERASELIIGRYEQYVGHKAPNHLLKEELEANWPKFMPDQPDL